MTKRKLTRRDFLTLSGILGSAAFMQACGALQKTAPTAQTSTAAPVAFSTATGKATPNTTATGTATAAGRPSPTADPTATATDTPTLEALAQAGETSPIEPTPTPSPTPYPPGPPSKLGLFITRFDPAVLALIEAGQPPLVKSLEVDANFAKGIKEMAPKTILIGRTLFDQMDLDADPILLAHQFVENLLPLATETRRLEAFDAWEAYNEPVADTPDKMKRLADFEAERTRLLAEQGVKSVVGNFATGHPPLELWPHFAPALAAIQQYGGYLGLHEYSAPIMQYGFGALQPDNGPDQGDEGWLTMRYRKAYRQYIAPMGFGNTPLLITECGVDGLVGNRPGPPEARGWQDFIDTWLSAGLRDDAPGVYMDQLIWYDTEMRQDGYVKGAAIFVAGASPGWESYEILGRTSALLQQYLEVHPQF